MSKRKKTNGLAGLCLGWKVCVVQGCFAKIPKHAHRNKCAKHHARQWKNNHPLKYAYNKLKYRAKERGHEFSLTFAEYEAFAIKTDYAKLKGRSGLSLSINRKNPNKGYSKSNIETMT